jgi:hypothetical protein
MPIKKIKNVVKKIVKPFVDAHNRQKTGKKKKDDAYSAYGESLRSGRYK